MRVQCIQWKWGKWKTTEHEISTQENLNAMELFYTCLKYPSCLIGYIRIVKMPIQKHMMHHWFVELVQLFLNFHYPVQKGYRHIFIFDTYIYWSETPRHFCFVIDESCLSDQYQAALIIIMWNMSAHPMYIPMSRECTMIQSEVRRKLITG